MLRGRLPCWAWQNVMENRSALTWRHPSIYEASQMKDRFVVNRGSNYCTSATVKISFTAKFAHIDIGCVTDRALKGVRRLKCHCDYNN